MEPDCRIEELRCKAMQELSIGRCIMVGAGSQVLSRTSTVQEAGLQVWCACGRSSRLLPHSQLFVTMVMWLHGGHASAGIQSNFDAFAAILDNGSVAAWGNPVHGGYIGKTLRRRWRNVQCIQPTEWAFAALQQDGSVITWGQQDVGGDSRAVQPRLRDVQHIQASETAFASTATAP